ncbi:hypothetical protein MYP_3265 [Sporocytophaga myxococcoides]|uniref:Uncharacterized protein n=1 Tax=Sporocytophaga myxococcoides TaxID=153721 RepID=A0A098LGC6_9BACT|nr:hypothetical protein MYP_3265 [Sporocytophaga myxococcoides]
MIVLALRTFFGRIRMFFFNLIMRDFEKNQLKTLFIKCFDEKYEEINILTIYYEEGFITSG